MNNSNTNNNDNIMIIITFFILANPYHRLLSLLQNSENACILLKENIKIQKNYWLCLSSKVPTDDCFAGLLLGDSALLLWVERTKRRTRSRNSTAVPTLQGLSSFMCVFLLCIP